MIPGIPNFSIVEPLIYRGGQPTAEGWSYLKSIGVTQVIKLNEDSEAVDNAPEGMALFKVEFSFIEQTFTEPHMDCLLDAVAFIGDNTFVHCKHGEDRTGAFRVRRCGWTKEKAYQEMLANGFHPVLFGLAKAWEDVNALTA